MTKPTGRPRGRPKTKEYVTLMARVPQELAERVQRYAGRKRQTMSDVLRDGLDLLLEEDRFGDFASDRNTEDAATHGARSLREPDNLSDTKEEHGEKQTDNLSDTKEECALPAVVSAAPQGEMVSDMKADTSPPLSDMLSDMNADESTREPLPAIVSDRKEAQVESPPAPAIVSDTNVPAFDTSKFYLGKLCPRGHAYQGTGQSLHWVANRNCVECRREQDRARQQARRQAQRQATHR